MTNEAAQSDMEKHIEFISACRPAGRAQGGSKVAHQRPENLKE